MHTLRLYMTRPVTMSIFGIVAGFIFAVAFSTFLQRHLVVNAPQDAPFRLEASTGGTVGTQDLVGQPYMMFFGYTHCPDACPTTLGELGSILNELKPSRRNIKTFFVTVDPSRDTASSLRDYLSSFGGGIVGLRGTEDQLAEITQQFHAFYRRVPQADGDYSMDHSALVYVRDGRNRSLGWLPIQNRPHAMNMLVASIDRVDQK